MTVRVSVVLPTFNRMTTLARAVHSVLAQTYSSLELVVVDDGSTDGTEKWIRGLDDQRVRYVGLRGRSGAAKARNAGIRASAGELIAFQDSDDEWPADRLAAQVAVMDSSGPEVGWVGGRIRVVDGPHAREVAPERVLAGVDHRADILDGQSFVTPAWLVRRSVLDAAGGFREDMPCLEDWDLVFRLDDLCQFRAVDQVVLVRYGSPDSLFSHEPSRAAGMEMILALHGHRWRECREDLATRYRDLAALEARLGWTAKAIRSYASAARVEPLAWRTYTGIARAALARTLRYRTVLL